MPRWHDPPITALRDGIAPSARDASMLTMDPGFAHWLAGLIDGEGSFDIRRQHSGAGWQTSLRLALRADDAEVIEHIRSETRSGTITRRRWSGTEVVTWNVYARADARHLASILTDHPLRSKKRNDFELWSRAVALEPGDPDHEALASALRALRTPPRHR